MTEVPISFAAVMLLAVLIFLMLHYARGHNITLRRRRPDRTQGRTPLESKAHDAGVADVYDGWIAWARDTTLGRAQTYEEWDAEQIAQKAKAEAAAYRSPSPIRDVDDHLAAALAQHPAPSWTVRNLQEHMTDLSPHLHRDDILSAQIAQINRRMGIAAAMITDLRQETYDPATATVNGAFAYHENPRVRAAYLAGRGAGTEKIMDTVTAARIRVRQIEQADLSVAAASERHAAALRALRETNPTTGAHDEHARYDAELRKITGDDQTTH